MRRVMNDRAEELRRLAEDWAAGLRGDAAFLEGGLTDEVVGIMPLGFVLNKERWLARYSSGDLAYSQEGTDQHTACW
jgi:hypothetical protein